MRLQRPIGIYTEEILLAFLSILPEGTILAEVTMHHGDRGDEEGWEAFTESVVDRLWHRLWRRSPANPENGGNRIFRPGTLQKRNT